MQKHAKFVESTHEVRQLRRDAELTSSLGSRKQIIHDEDRLRWHLIIAYRGYTVKVMKSGKEKKKLYPDQARRKALYIVKNSILDMMSNGIRVNPELVKAANIVQKRLEGESAKTLEELYESRRS